MWPGDMASFMLHWFHEKHLYQPASISCKLQLFSHFLSPIDTYSVRLTFNSLPIPTSSATWLLACPPMRNGFGSVQKGLTFVRRMCWLSWHFNFDSRDSCDAALQEEGQRQPGWACQFQAASVLDDCGNCCCSFRVAGKGSLCSFVGQFWKDSLLQLCFHVRIMYGASQSFHVKSVKDEGWKLQVPWLVGCVCRSLRVGVILYYKNAESDRFQYHETQWQVQDWVQMLTAISS